MKINCKIILKDLNRKDIDLTFGQALGQILVNSSTKGGMKIYILADKLANEKLLEIDIADLSLIKKEVEETKVYNNLIIGQCQLLLEDIKDK